MRRLRTCVKYRARVAMRGNGRRPCSGNHETQGAGWIWQDCRPGLIGGRRATGYHSRETESSHRVRPDRRTHTGGPDPPDLADMRFSAAFGRCRAVPRRACGARGGGDAACGMGLLVRGQEGSSGVKCCIFSRIPAFSRWHFISSHLATWHCIKFAGRSLALSRLAAFRSIWPPLASPSQSGHAASLAPLHELTPAP